MFLSNKYYVISGIAAVSIQYFNFILVTKNGQKKIIYYIFNILKKVSSHTPTVVVTIENEKNPDNSPSFFGKHESK